MKQMYEVYKNEKGTFLKLIIIMQDSTIVPVINVCIGSSVYLWVQKKGKKNERKTERNKAWKGFSFIWFLSFFSLLEWKISWLVDFLNKMVTQLRLEITESHALHCHICIFLLFMNPYILGRCEPTGRINFSSLFLHYPSSSRM